MDFIDPRARDVVRVSGPDALDYLQSQISQDIRPMAVGDTRWTFVLEPSGHVHTLARITRVADDSFELDTDAGFGGELRSRLARFMIRVDIDLELVAAEASEPSADAEAARIAAGWPRMGAEIEPGSTIPAATSVTPVAVDFAKGCYPGQELVERMDSRGSDAPQSLRVITLGGDGGDGAQPGDPLVGDDGSDVGRITSVGDGLALAYVRRGVDLGASPDHAS